MGHRKFDFGHLRSQKFAGLVFCVAVCAGIAFALTNEKFSTLVMGVVALYTAFVGGRAWSDGQSLKYGGAVGPTDNSVVKAVPKAPVAPAKEKDRGVD